MKQTTDTTNYDTAYALAILLAAVYGWQNQSTLLGGVVAVLLLGSIYGHSQGFWVQLWQMVQPHLKELATAVSRLFQKSDEIAEMADEPYQFSPGKEIESNQFIVTDLEEIGSFLVCAITRGGKTALLHSIIYQLLATDELELVIADLKNGLDFSIFRWLRHLRVPIATTPHDAGVLVDYLLAELNRRSELFKATPEKKLCNNLHDYHRLGKPLGLPRLPRILAIFDEFQNLTHKNAAALDGLTELAKMGQAFGITIVCSTQLPKVDDIPTRLKSQFVSWFCGYLANPSHYYKIVEIEKEYWEPFHAQGKIAGRFIASIAGERTVIQSLYVKNSDLEQAAEVYSNDHEPSMPEIEPMKPEVYDWSGSEDRKRAMFLQWLAELGHEPTADEAVATFGFSQATFYNWMQKLEK